MADNKRYARTESPRVIRTKGIEPSRSRKKKRRRKNRMLGTVLSLLLILVIGAAGIGGYYLISIGSELGGNEIDESNLGIDLEDMLFHDTDNTTITNIALFGVDQRQDEACRSDAIMVLSVDKKHGKIKVSSLLRDSLVQIEGHGQNKMAHAYYYGGPELAIRTINENFGLNIRDYVTVNFNELAQIVDAVGGVDIAVKEKECYYLNKNLREQAKYDNFSAKSYYINTAGEYHLNGQQALAYARIRKADSDLIRTDRQRKVMRQIFNQALSMNKLRYPEFARQFLAVCETSLDFNDCISLAGIMAKNPQFIDLRLPLKQHLIDGNYYVNGVSYVYYDVPATAVVLRDFIYNDMIPDEANPGVTPSASSQTE